MLQLLKTQERKKKLFLLYFWIVLRKFSFSFSLSLTSFWSSISCHRSILYFDTMKNTIEIKSEKVTTEKSLEEMRTVWNEDFYTKNLLEWEYSESRNISKKIQYHFFIIHSNPLFFLSFHPFFNSIFFHYCYHHHSYPSLNTLQFHLFDCIPHLNCHQRKRRRKNEWKRKGKKEKK